MKFDDLVREANNKRTHTPHIESECITYKLTDEIKVQKRKVNAFALTTNTQPTKLVVHNKEREVVAQAENYLIEKLNLYAYESVHGDIKLNLLYDLELSAYVQYIKYVYMGKYIDSKGTIHKGSIYAFELYVPNMFNEHLIGVNLLDTHYYKYNDYDELINHVISECHE